MAGQFAYTIGIDKIGLNLYYDDIEVTEWNDKHLSEGIFELRAKLGTDITRVLYFFYVDRHIILTNGFIKKTNKTPTKEIERAKKYRSDYLRRKEEEK